MFLASEKIKGGSTMSKQKKDSHQNIMEYYDWGEKQRFAEPQENHKYVSKEEQDFLQYDVYSMFYKGHE